MNTLQETTGLFGKLPAHGDFMQRNLSSAFITSWDEWLQHFIAGTQEQLGEDWLNYYLTSPIWRFAFSAGVIDENNWAGIMLPSVDRVGRYFPLSIVRKLDADVNPFEFIQFQGGWYQSVEELALDTLEEEISIDELMQQLDNIALNHQSDYSMSGYNHDGNAFHFDMEFEEQSVSTVYPLLLDSIMKNSFQSYSVWQTSGSECISPGMFTSQGLPDVQKMPAMLNGEWQHHSWQQPYLMNQQMQYREEV